ncbi:MAG: nucleoside triphosphate pyrophosphohydrolase [Rhodobiaceae bacterium]|nr:nucleoside triphosphate pyrophosphohydrolase [Rhodobiaceae bacterium]MCC0057354.1 nucleoside triphosphate pyrophosphohydrolase [Rhodobiaceae bacterium]
MQPSRDIQRLIEIMAALRDPQTGCPWVVAQDFSTIAPYAIEEAHEVADAISRGDMEDLTDELGDLLLQVVFHAQMATERGAFDFGDVVEAITTKMIRRHPHVFADVAADSPDAVKRNWEEIKQAEKAARGRAEKPVSRLDEVAASLPALTRSVKLQKQAAKIGFDWPSSKAVLDKIREETDELAEATQARASRDELRSELGDLLFAVTNLCRHLDISPEQAMIEANAKFSRRFATVERRYDQRMDDGDGAPDIDEMESWWQAAKADD